MGGKNRAEAGGFWWRKEEKKGIRLPGIVLTSFHVNERGEEKVMAVL